MPERHSFASRAQWRWAFSTHKTWARRWAHSSRPFKTLPPRASAKITATTFRGIGRRP